ncbi:endoribonuclease L-PSP [Afipia sp. P52-10]|nr:RidA family protein [Afipia sp. P52-10]ETR76595.1 endoribonuclease L-PSP [Afipia sp. P52-10]
MITRHEPSSILHGVVRHGNTLYLAGVVAEDLSQDMAGQAAQVFAEIDELLNKHGSDKEHILAATIYVTDIAEKAAMNPVWTKWLPSHALPARATIGINDLGPGVKIEVVVTAAVKG